MSRPQALTIRTPEGIEFPLLIADPITRFLALVIDKVVIYAVCFLSSMVFSLFNLISIDIASALGLLSSFIVSLGYPIILEWFWQGQTIGKRIFRLRVMDEQGLHLHFSQVAVRNFLRFVDVLPAFYFVGGVSCVLNRHGQRVGDIAANTIVIRHPRITSPDLNQILPDKYNSFRAYPHLAARLRKNVSPAEAGVALQALVRRDTLDDMARLKLFLEIRKQVEKAVVFPGEVIDGLSDEQYIRNSVDILLR